MNSYKFTNKMQQKTSRLNFFVHVLLVFGFISLLSVNLDSPRPVRCNASQLISNKIKTMPTDNKYKRTMLHFFRSTHFLFIEHGIRRGQCFFSLSPRAIIAGVVIHSTVLLETATILKELQFFCSNYFSITHLCHTRGR